MIDQGALFSQVFSSIWWLIPAAVVIAILKSPWFKGKMGEGLVNLATNIRLDNSIYQNLHDVTLNLPDGSTTQIDHIIISPYGIFVIETKNYQGWIYGGESQKTWTQNIYGKKHTFQNPLHQNYRHVKALQDLLEFEDNIHSVVVFAGECKFKTAMPDNVCLGGSYISYIKLFRKKIFSPDELARIRTAIEDGRKKKGFQTNREHVAGLKRRLEEQSEPSYKNNLQAICKRCGGAMVERRNKKTGQKFLGCSNYPKCRNIEQI